MVLFSFLHFIFTSFLFLFSVLIIFGIFFSLLLQFMFISCCLFLLFLLPPFFFYPVFSLFYNLLLLSSLPHFSSRSSFIILLFPYPLSFSSSYSRLPRSSFHLVSVTFRFFPSLPFPSFIPLFPHFLILFSSISFSVHWFVFCPSLSSFPL